MSDVPGLYRQSRPVPSPFPPHPYLELHGRGEVYLILPHSGTPHDLERFQVFSHGAGWHRDFIGKLGLERLLRDLKNGHAVFGSGTTEIGAIRRFYMDWHHVAPMEQPKALVDRLERDIERGSLTVFRFQHDPHMGIIRQDPGEIIPPSSGSVATWSARQKVVAMFRAIPDYLEGAAKAEFEAFLTPENLIIMGVFLGGIGALQAVPGADAAVDGMIAGLAWWQFGWAGVIAGKDFVEAVIKANRATTHAEIMLAAKLAAAALVSLGITVLLNKITENVREVRWTQDENPSISPSASNSDAQPETNSSIWGNSSWGNAKADADAPPNSMVGDGKSFAGHGGIFSNSDGTLPTTTVPPGTNVTVFTGINNSMADPAGQLIESGNIESGMNLQSILEPDSTNGAMTYLSGSEIPDYTLFPGDGLGILPGSMTVDTPTSLSSLLAPNMGTVNWAACTTILGE